MLVIGAGAGGGVAVRHLAEAGFRVVCLEQGDWPDASEFPGDKLEWELVADAQWSPNPNTRRQPADYPLEVSRSPITPVMYNAVGGSTVHFCAQWVRMRPQEFRLRTVDGLADDWPISYDEMKPFYEQIDQEMMISGMTGDPAYPPGPPPLQPPLPIGAAGPARRRGHEPARLALVARGARDPLPGGRATSPPASAPAPACGAARKAPRARPTRRCSRKR